MNTYKSLREMWAWTTSLSTCLSLLYTKGQAEQLTLVSFDASAFLSVFPYIQLSSAVHQDLSWIAIAWLVCSNRAIDWTLDLHWTAVCTLSENWSDYVFIWVKPHYSISLKILWFSQQQSMITVFTIAQRNRIRGLNFLRVQLGQCNGLCKQLKN